MNIRIDKTAGTALPDTCYSASSLLTPGAVLKIVLDGVEPIEEKETLPLSQAQGRITSGDILSDVALPRFDNSAVDGFGLHADDLAASFPLSLELGAPVHAGQGDLDTLCPGRAVRILTGARIPPGVAAVIMEERARRKGSTLALDAAPECGANIRRAGEDVATGATVIRQGVLLRAHHIAMLAAIGKSEIEVRQRLRVGIISTGDEIVNVTTRVRQNQIVDSNRPMLVSLLNSPAIDVADLGIVNDCCETLSASIIEAATHLDLLISTGGVSGSEADYLKPAMLVAGGTCDDLKTALRPGKPIAYGALGNMRVLSLPGNPVAALVNFLLFARPLIRKLSGIAAAETDHRPARASETFFHKAGRTEFVPVSISGYDDIGLPLLRKLGRGGSARLMPLMQADGFAELETSAANIEAGGDLRFYPFSFDTIL